MDEPILSFATARKLGALLRDQPWARVENVARMGLHALAGFPSPEPAYRPTWLVLFATPRCNLRCQHCQYHAPEAGEAPRTGRELAPERLGELLDRFPEVVNASLTGGEPLLHRRLGELLRLLAGRRVKVHLPTNGSLLAEHLDLLLEGPLEQLNVSLYGLDGMDYAARTGASPELFERTTEAIAELTRRRSRSGSPRSVRVSFVVTRSTLGRMPEMVRLAESLDCDSVRLQNLIDYGLPGFDARECLFADDPDAERAIAALARLGSRIPISPPRLYHRQPAARRCRLPFTSLTVDGDGALGPCCVIGADPGFGTLDDRGEPWNHPSLTAFRRRFMNPSSPLPAPCRTCEHLLPEPRPIPARG